ncbi:MAG: HRDC domain-containing protein [Bacteroidales bacterium]|jgi:superfamily II DNA helicase RecQ|nr:HRDC domain-containing protein [Bacteroidales bacterium]
MKFKIYNIPASDSETWLVEMNKFLETHKVIQVNRSCSVVNDHLYWTFCIEYLESLASQNIISDAKSSKDAKIDYKEVLSDEHFIVFDKLRRARKRIGSENTDKPLYFFFKNSELADISQLPEITVAAIKNVKGIGEKRADEWGAKLVEYYNAVGQEDSLPELSLQESIPF